MRMPDPNSSIDADSWIDHHLINAFMFNVDAFRLSGYFYKDRSEKIKMGPNQSKKGRWKKSTGPRLTKT